LIYLLRASRKRVGSRDWSAWKKQADFWKKQADLEEYKGSHVCVVVAYAVAFVDSFSFSLFLGALAVFVVALFLRGFVVRVCGAVFLHLAIALSILSVFALRLGFAAALLFALLVPVAVL
jgi:hypothetical protein